ncbi:MAG TPA: hypothetical protein VMU45_06365 [Candidatus Eisenbacteria bacterium]|nr:hypothetical protein [Candidatus Eisenbacteria bacterium]
MLQRQQLQERLDSLQKEFEIGQTRLKELEKEEAYVRETLLRISGAMQVLKELLQGSPEPGSAEHAKEVGAAG